MWLIEPKHERPILQSISARVQTRNAQESVHASELGGALYALLDRFVAHSRRGLYRLGRLLLRQRQSDVSLGSIRVSIEALFRLGHSLPDCPCGDHKLPENLLVHQEEAEYVHGRQKESDPNNKRTFLLVQLLRHHLLTLCHNQLD